MILQILNFMAKNMRCLNPYCNGCTSMISSLLFDRGGAFRVSILIVMDVLQ